jgi:hypothetical protein
MTRNGNIAWQFAARRAAFSHQGYDSSRTWIGKASESKPIKVNQGESRWIKVDQGIQYCFWDKPLGHPPAAWRQESTYGGSRGTKNTELTSAPGL